MFRQAIHPIKSRTLSSKLALSSNRKALIFQIQQADFSSNSQGGGVPEEGSGPSMIENLFDQQKMQGMMMDAGVEAGKQAFEVAKAFRELYVDQDDEEDNEILISVSDSEKEKIQNDRVRSDIVQSILRANHLA